MPPPPVPPMDEKLPPPRAWLPTKVEELTVALPAFKRPPPKTSPVAYVHLRLIGREPRVVPPSPWRRFIEDAAAAVRVTAYDAARFRRREARLCLKAMFWSLCGGAGRGSRDRRLRRCPRAASPSVAALRGVRGHRVIAESEGGIVRQSEQGGEAIEMPPPSPKPPAPPMAWLSLTLQLVTDMTPENESSSPPPTPKAAGKPLPPAPPQPRCR